MWFCIVRLLNFCRFWEAFWAPKSIKNRSKFDIIPESVLEAVFETRQGEAGGRGGAPRTLLVPTKQQGILHARLPASRGGGSEGFASAASPLRCREGWPSIVSDVLCLCARNLRKHWGAVVAARGGGNVVL